MPERQSLLPSENNSSTLRYSNMVEISDLMWTWDYCGLYAQYFANILKLFQIHFDDIFLVIFHLDYYWACQEQQ